MQCVELSCKLVPAAQALKHLSAQHEASAGTANGESQPSSAAFLQDALLRRLLDQEPAVISTTLTLPVLRRLNSTKLYPAIASVLARYAEVAGDPERKAEHKAWRAVARKVACTCPLAAMKALRCML